MNTTSAAKSVTLKNSQTVALTISSISTSGNFAQTSTCPITPATLAANASCTISVTFTPTAVGTLTGTLTVSDDAPNSPQTATLTGTGVAPVTLSPTSLSFGNQVINTTSAAKSVTLKNNQAVPLTISSISSSGNFAQTSTCPISPATLAAKASCTISVTFTPTALGSLTGTLTINDDASNSPQTVQLSGTGVIAVSLSPSDWAFGNQIVNTTSAAKSVTLKNNQTVALTISSISTSGNFAQTSTCPISPATLAANASCTISVTFTPTAAGILTGTLTVSDNAPNSPQTATLTGTGVAPVTLSPASLSFGNQVIDTTSSATSVTLKNNQAVPLTISSIATSGNFAQTSTCPISPATLAAKTNCTISVKFTPTAPGSLTGTVTITDDAGTSPQTVSLTGTGTLSGLVSISLTPANPTLPAGTQQQFVATGKWKNGMTVDISQFVSWSSSAPTVASVNSNGLAQALTQGAATINASYGSVSGATAVTVAPPTLISIAVSPNAPSIAAGAYQQFTAVLTYSDGSTKVATPGSVTWSSSAVTVATVNSSGLASALTAGSATITATAGSVSGSATLTVFQPSCVNAPTGLIGWWTGDGNTVDIAGNNSGTLQNGATYGNGEVGQAFSFAGNGASALVNSPVYSPTAGTLMFWFLPTGAGSLTGSFDGTNRTPGLDVDASGNVTWEFGNLSAQILGQVSFNQWSQAALTYAPSNSQVAVNVYLNGNLAASATSSQNSSWYSQLAFGAYLGGQKPTFAGSMDEVMIFNQALSAQQIQPIYSAFSAGVCKPTLQTITLTPQNPSVSVGLSQQFDAVGSYSDSTTHDLTTSATWSSSAPAVATINGSGLATTLANGNSTISAALGVETGSTNLSVGGQSLISIQVNPQNPSIAAGTTLSFTAIGTFSDGSTQDLTASVSWSSSAPAVATIATGGLATGIAAGQATITATAGLVTGSTLLTVTPVSLSSITITPANSSLAIGQTQQFTATGHYTDGSTQDLTSSVTWGSSQPAVATIASAGLASALSGGSTTITAALGSINASATLSVNSNALVSIAIVPANPSIALGTNQQFAAIGTYADGSTLDLTTSATWNSSAPSVATANATGLATSVSTGQTTITAVAAAVTGSTSLTVQDVLVSISVAPQNDTIGFPASQQFTATGTYASGSTSDLTGTVVWNSSAPAVATIDSSGLVTSEAEGQTVITGTLGSIAGSANLAVSTLAIPTNFRADISDGTTGQLFVSWDEVSGASYYNLQRSTNPNSGYSMVDACSGLANLGNTNTVGAGSMQACRDGGLTVGTFYYYQVQACDKNSCSGFSAPASNVPVSSDCTPTQMPNVGSVQTLPRIALKSSTVDPGIQFLPNNNQFAWYASPAVPRQNLLFVDLPGSSETCPGAPALDYTASKLGFDVICVNYSNLAGQVNICAGDPNCFGYVSQAKEDATGICSTSGQPQCGIDPKTGQPYYNSNPADAIVQRISMMLQYLNTNGYNQNGTNWGNYLSGTTPVWQNILLGGHSQGGAMATFTAYEHTVARVINLSAPMLATPVNGVEVAATYLSNTPATNIRNIYGLVSVYDQSYQGGLFSADWQAMGLTQANNDAEVMLNTSTPIGLNCNSGIPSHNFSTSAMPGGDGNGHNATLYLWNEDIYKFMLID